MVKHKKQVVEPKDEAYAVNLTWNNNCQACMHNRKEIEEKVLSHDE